MNTNSALEDVLEQLDRLIDAAHVRALMLGLDSSWIRDKSFVSAVRAAVGSENGAQQALYQMRNLSQGFGSYSKDLEELDRCLDRLHRELKQFVVNSRSAG